MSKQTQGLIAINIAAVIFGSAALYGKLEVSPVWIVACRAAFAAIALLGLGGWKNELAWPSHKTLKRIAITGVILTLHWVSFFASVQKAGIAIATLTFAAFPLFTVLIETFKRKKWPHLLECSAGLAILLAVRLLVSFDSGTSEQLLGTVLGLGSAVTFAAFGVASKGLAISLSPVLVSLYQNSVVFLSLAPFLFCAERAPHGWTNWGCLVLLGVVTTAIMHQLYFYALKRLSATICSGFVALEPVYAVIFAAMFFGETISVWVALSGLLIVGASFLLLYYDRKYLK